MDAIQKRLESEDIQHQQLLGYYTLSQRRKALERFKTDPDTTVFLLSVRAASAGLTLTAASYVFIFEPGFNPAITLQAINRVYRIGQSKQVRKLHANEAKLMPCIAVCLTSACFVMFCYVMYIR